MNRVCTVVLYKHLTSYQEMVEDKYNGGSNILLYPVTTRVITELYEVHMTSRSPTRTFRSIPDLFVLDNMV